MAHRQQESDHPFDQDSVTRRKERLETEAGVLWVWELMAGDTTLIAEYSTRPALDPRGGIDRGEAVMWQVALSCYDGEAEEAKRIWPDQDLWKIGRLPERIFQPILAAINRVNGKSATEEEILRDFTQATGARNTSE